MDVVACRVCLSTDLKLYSLDKYGLRQAFDEITSIPLSPLDGLPQHVCYICSAQLLKHVSFKAKCNETNALLRETRCRGDLITQEYLKTVNRATHFTIANVNKINFIDNKPETAEEKCENFDYIDDEIFDIKQEVYFDDDNDINEDTDRTDHEDICKEKSVLSKTIVGSKTDATEENSNSIYYTDADTVLQMHSIIIEADDKVKPAVKRVKKEKNATKKVKKNIKVENFTDSDDEVLTVKKLKYANKRNKDPDRLLMSKILKKVEAIKEFAGKYNAKATIYSKDDQLKEVLDRKDTDAYKKARLRCDVCFKGFITDTAYNNHKLTHDPTRGQYKCDICQMYFQKKVTRDRHADEHRIKYTCEQCGESFTNPNLVRVHFRFHKGIQYECKICKKTYRKLTTYYNHKRNSHASVTCALCGEAYVGEQGLHGHMMKSHREALNCRCSSCGVRFQNDEVLQKHTNSGCHPTVKACARCGEGFPNQEALDAHLEDVHKTIKIFNCDECDRTFTDEHYLGLHWNKVHSTKARPRQRNVLSMPRDKPGRKQEPFDYLETRLMCDLCGKGFMNKTMFTFHMRLHTGEKPHQCSICPKAFRLPMSLKAHMNVHTDERPYQCSLCPRAFRQATHRNSHMLVHTQEKPHPCEICSKRFSLAANMREHMRTVHAGLPPRRRQRRAQRTQ